MASAFEAIDAAVIKDNLTDLAEEYTLYDRIVNVKFTDSKGQTYTIRSDYEIEFTPDGKKYEFMKCRQKPEIKVEYDKVTNNLQISIKLTIVNFHMNFTASENSIEDVTIQLGYFGQFPDFTNPANGLTAEDFYQLRDPNFAIRKYEHIECMVLAVYPVRLPPDGAIQFNCVIGTSQNPLHSRQDETDSSIKFRSDLSIDDYLFETITRRFPRARIPAAELQVEAGSGGLIDTGGGVKESVPGPMTRDTALRYGVRCFVTEELSAEGFKVDQIPAITRSGNVMGAIAEISDKILPYSRYLFLPSGNVVVYLAGQSADSVAASLKKKYANIMDQLEVPSTKVLPAIYSITYSGVRSIQCPFFALVKPFQTIKFSSEYNLGNLISYYYSPEAGQETFLAINYKVKFSTTGDENTMDILSTDTEEGK